MRAIKSIEYRCLGNTLYRKSCKSIEVILDCKSPGEIIKRNNVRSRILDEKKVTLKMYVERFKYRVYP